MERCWLLSAALVAVLTTQVAGQGNVLVIVADDLGVDRVGAYAEHANPGRTPNIDALAARGVLFRNAWANPVCSPTRAGALTGRYSFRTGIGNVIGYSDGKALDLDETTLPELLAHGQDVSYGTAAIGKWHLGTASTGGSLHPLLTGFDFHRGSLSNFGAAGFPENYYNWFKNVDGVLVPVSAYATSEAVDDALVVMEGMGEPWFVWLAFNAPHQPFHAPPDELHSFNLSGSPGATPVAHMKAAVEAMDTEIGRLLQSMGPAVLGRTTIIFVGDNGTDSKATTAPFKQFHAKGTVYEGGVNVPLIIAGPDVREPGRECAGLVTTVDLFATVADLAGIDLAHLLPDPVVHDSVSLIPYLNVPETESLRRHVYAEIFSPNGQGPYVSYDRAVRDVQYKLVLRSLLIQGPFGPVLVEQDELYDLVDDPFEANDLLSGPPSPEILDAYANLNAAIAGILAAEG